MNKAPCQRSHGLRLEPGTAANRTLFKPQGHTDWRAGRGPCSLVHVLCLQTLRMQIVRRRTQYEQRIIRILQKNMTTSSSCYIRLLRKTCLCEWALQNRQASRDVYDLLCLYITRITSTLTQDKHRKHNASITALRDRGQAEYKPQLSSP